MRKSPSRRQSDHALNDAADLADGTGLIPLETLPNTSHLSRQMVVVSLFWRTFFLLAALLMGSMLAWLVTLRALDFTPRAVLIAQQIASQVNLSRAALTHVDAIARVSLIKAMADTEGVRIVPREPKDQFLDYTSDSLSERVALELKNLLGSTTTVARSVNGVDGLWVGFEINGDANWLQLNRERFNPGSNKIWLVWLLTIGALSLTGAARISRLINRPLKHLSFATSRVRQGDFDASHLDERGVTGEVREVNIGFNRMAQKLAKIEQDRVVMLAGISHDLRTPLARLRLETEMSVTDDDARDHMVADIEQLDAIIDKFLDYARPGHAKLSTVSLNDVLESSLYAVLEYEDMRIQLNVDASLMVLADEVELGRVIANLLENARRYGKSPNTGIAVVEISAKARDRWVLLKVRDRGQGVKPEQLSSLSKPFFRGDAARTEATGAGLGLSIVDKAIQRMGGEFELANTTSGGLAAYIKLQRA